MNLLYPLFYLIGKAPSPLVYGLAGVARFIAFSLFGYRKKVIIKQLKDSFPSKSNSEIQAIYIAFSKNLSHVLFESLFLFGKSWNFFKRRVSFQGGLELQKALNQKSQIIVCGHMANWEWGSLIQQKLELKQPVFAAYHPLKNKLFDKVVRKSRERFGIQLIPMHQMAKTMLQHRNKSALFILIADQCPAKINNAIWVDFLNHPDTPFINGPEKLVQKMEFGLFYGAAQRTQKGHYTYTLSPLTTEQPTHSFARALEANIHEHPEQWLWSHRRWKRTKPQ